MITKVKCCWRSEGGDKAQKKREKKEKKKRREKKRDLKGGEKHTSGGEDNKSLKKIKELHVIYIVMYIVWVMGGRTACPNAVVFLKRETKTIFVWSKVAFSPSNPSFCLALYIWDVGTYSATSDNPHKPSSFSSQVCIVHIYRM